MISEEDNKIYYIMFALTIQTVYLVMMMMMIQVIFQHDEDDEVAEIFRKQVT